MTDKVTNKELDIIDFISVLWKKKYLFLISFISSFLILYCIIFFLKKDYTNYNSTITLQVIGSNQLPYIPFDRISTEMAQTMQSDLSPQDLYFEMNSEYYENKENFNNYFKSTIESKNLGKLFENLLAELGDINSSTFEIDKDLLVITSEATSFGRSLNYDQMLQLRETFIDYYQMIIEKIKKEVYLMKNSTHELVANHLNDQIKTHEKDIKAQEIALVDLYKKIESFNNLGDRDAYWNNFLFVSNQVTQNEQNLVILKRNLYELNSFKNIYNEYVNNYEIPIRILEFKTKIETTESLINNNAFMTLVILIISLIIGIIVVYIQLEINHKKNQF